MRRALFLVLILLASCAARPGPGVLDPVTVTGAMETRLLRVWMMTTRSTAPGETTPYGSGRAPSPRFGYFDISVPPGHQQGQIEWPKGKPDPEHDFVTRDAVTLSERDFLKSLGGEQIGIYVHGYNTSFQEALYRLAQLSADAHLNGSPVLFSWPSEAHVAGYMADRDAADYSRSALVWLMRDLTARRSPDHPVLVLGHSMGGRLTMEALRQLKLEGRTDVLDRLDVVLAAPDIDLDMFREQMAVIGKLRHPLTVLVSSDDRALAVSARIASRHSRLGTVDVNNPAVRAMATNLGIRVIDITSLPSDDPAHSRYVGLLSGTETNKIENIFEGLRQVGAFALDQFGL